MTICLSFDTCTCMFAFLKKLKSLQTSSARRPATGEDLDFTWFRNVEYLVINEYLDKAKNTQLGLERVYHVLLKTGTATLDTERGSLTLNLKNVGTFVFVINDVQTGAQIEAAMLATGIGHLARAVALGQHDHTAACCLELIHIRIHSARRGRPERAGGVAVGSFRRASVIDAMILEVLR